MGRGHAHNWQHFTGGKKKAGKNRKSKNRAKPKTIHKNKYEKEPREEKLKRLKRLKNEFFERNNIEILLERKREVEGNDNTR